RAPALAGLRPDADVGRNVAPGLRRQHPLHPHRVLGALPRDGDPLPLPGGPGDRAWTRLTAPPAPDDEDSGPRRGGRVMEALWFAIVAGMLAVYVVLDGFDFGAGFLHLIVARTDAERRMVLAAIGPVWDGNEVWLLAGGGVLFMAFPAAYAVGFSGFYLPLMLLLWV